MYETLMDMTLFKGASRDDISHFLEKTRIMFVKYPQGDRVIEKDGKVDSLKFVIQGKLRIVHHLDNFCLTVEDERGKGVVPGIDRLFGLSTSYPFEAYAGDNCSIMEFSKDQFIDLLYMQKIFLLNFFNYLSLKAQRAQDLLSGRKDLGIKSCFQLLVGIFTDIYSEKIKINGTRTKLCHFLKCSEKDLRDWIQSTENTGVVNYENDTIEINSRSEFLKL